MAKHHDHLDRIGLLPGEEVLKVVHPHPLAFYRTYLGAMLVALISLVWEVVGQLWARHLQPSDMRVPLYMIDQALYLSGLNHLRFDWHLAESQIESLWVALLWGVFMVIAGVVISLLKINFLWLFGMIFAAVVSILAATGLGQPALSPLFGVVFSILAILVYSWYLQRHMFIITNQRLIMLVDFLFYHERDLLFSRLSDLAIEQSLVGRIFNFGTLIPISVAGFGLGANLAGVAVGPHSDKGQINVFGAQQINVPRASSAYVLFGVPAPRAVHNLLESMIHQHAESTHLSVIRQELSRVKFLQHDRESSARPDLEERL